MLLLVTLVGVIVISRVFKPFERKVLGRYVSVDLEFFGIFASLVLVACLVAIPVFRVGVHIEVEKYYALKQTLENIRSAKDVKPQEAAAIQLKVIEMNKSLAEWKFLARSPWLNVFVPKKVLKLEFLR